MAAKKKKSPAKKNRKSSKKSPAKSKKGKKKAIVKIKKAQKKSIPKKKIAVQKKGKPEKVKKPAAAAVKPAIPEKKEAMPVAVEIIPALSPVKKSKKAPKIPQKKIIVMQPVYPYINKPLERTPGKEPNGKFTLEYVVRASPQILYEFISTPSGLAEWFADNVNITKDHYTFIWNGQEQHANILGMKDDKFIRFQWAEKNDGSYFEFRIELDDLTGDVSLMITDFAEESDRESSRLLWDSQIQKLLKVLGSF